MYKIIHNIENYKIHDMKNQVKIIALAAFLTVVPLILSAQYLPTHPNGGNDPGPSNTPVGGGAPIDGGLSVLLMLGAAYGAKRILQQQK